MGAWFQFQVGQGGYGEADTMVRGVHKKGGKKNLWRNSVHPMKEFKGEYKTET
jgi:hypothetical protein